MLLVYIIGINTKAENETLVVLDIKITFNALYS